MNKVSTYYLENVVGILDSDLILKSTTIKWPKSYLKQNYLNTLSFEYKDQNYAFSVTGKQRVFRAKATTPGQN